MPTPTQLHVRSVLVIEDDADAQLLCALQLAAADGFELRATAATLGEALLLLRRCTVDVILLDRHLPDGDGIEAIAELRASAPGSKIVLLTAQSRSLVGRRSAAEGAGYIDKLDLCELAMLLERELDTLAAA